MLRLIFVYNSKAGVVAGIMDSIHKAVSPDTYECSLCAITYGALAMNKQWKAYLETLELPMHFYHRPDFRLAFPEQQSLALPLIALDRDGMLEPVLTASELGALPDLDALMAALDAGLAAHQR
jgi:hypothetical protein